MPTIRAQSNRDSLAATGLLQRLVGNPRRTALSILAVLYAAFAGLRTVADPDIGWQLATGRWIVQHHAVPNVDVLSYTAHGAPWIYPALSQAIFYLLVAAGGFAALSWMSAAVCVAITALLARGSLVTRCLVILLVPLIANRTIPRAEVFTELFFAAYLVLLWKYRRSGNAPLWLLPLLMLLWVNTHMGFIAGLALCGAYVLFELEDCLQPPLRATALPRLRRALPWFAASAAATLITPFSIRRNFEGLAILVPAHSNPWVAELQGLPVHLSTVAKALDVRDPRSAVWMFLGIAVASILAALLRRRFAAAIVLGTAMAAVIHSVRFSTMFGMIVAVVGGEALASWRKVPLLARCTREMQRKVSLPRFSSLTAAVLCTVLGVLVVVRVADLVSNRAYIRAPQQSSSFGAGQAFWYPEQAAAFMQQNRLPGNLFNEYNTGGFLAYRLGPQMPVYLDGRAAPFGEQLVSRALDLQVQRLDSPAWQQEAAARNINTVLFSLDMEFGAVQSNLRKFCQSTGWRLAYLDTQAIVFTRATGLQSAPPLSCYSVAFNNPPQYAGPRGRAEQFRYYRNAAAILLSLGRMADFWDALARAESLYPDNMAIHYMRGAALQAYGRLPEAERELTRARQQEPSAETWRALALLYRQQGRLPEATEATRQAILFSPRPQNLYLELGSLQTAQGQPSLALASYDQAEKSYGARPSTYAAANFFAALNRNRAAAWSSLAMQYLMAGKQSEAEDAQRRAAQYAAQAQ